MMKSEQTSGGENMEKFGGTVSLFGACVVGYKDDGTNRDGWPGNIERQAHEFRLYFRKPVKFE